MTSTPCCDDVALRAMDGGEELLLVDHQVVDCSLPPTSEYYFSILIAFQDQPTTIEGRKHSQRVMCLVA